MCISKVLLTLAAREQNAQEVANNYRSRLVVCLVSIAVVGETTALQQTRRLVAVWLSASRVHKMLGAKLGSYRLPITATSAGLLPDRGAWDRLHHSISLPKLKRLPLPADVHCRSDTAVGWIVT